MNRKYIERQSLLVSVFVNFLIGMAGLLVYIVTNLNALLLDGVFSLIAFVSSLAALYISKNSHRTTESFPNGMYFLEPLYGILKSIATLLLLVITLLETSASAYAYFVHQEGQAMVTGPVLPYTIAMVLLCFGLGAYNSNQNRKINHMSTMLAAESRGNYIDGLISAGVGVAIIALSLVDIQGPLGFLHYTGDFFITLILVMISLKEPISVLANSFKEFARSTIQGNHIHDKVLEIFHQVLNSQTDKLDILVFKQGMYIKVKIYILTPDDAQLIENLATKKSQFIDLLEQEFDHCSLEFSF